EVTERLLRARAVLGADEPLAVESIGDWHAGDGGAAGFLSWPWRWLVFHVPERRLPAIAGLATDPGPRSQAPSGPPPPPPSPPHAPAEPARHGGRLAALRAQRLHPALVHPEQGPDPRAVQPALQPLCLRPGL